MALNVAPSWHCSQRFFQGAPANCPSCSSLWQSTQSANLILNFVFLPAGVWHEAHLTAACGKIKREAGLRVIGNGERGRAPALNGVATLASAAIGALQETGRHADRACGSRRRRRAESES